MVSQISLFCLVLNCNFVLKIPLHDGLGVLLQPLLERFNGDFLSFWEFNSVSIFVFLLEQDELWSIFSVNSLSIVKTGVHHCKGESLKISKTCGDLLEGWLNLACLFFFLTLVEHHQDILVGFSDDLFEVIAHDSLYKSCVCIWNWLGPDVWKNQSGVDVLDELADGVNCPR